ncbi:hypothetical protein BKM31_16140 [[Actinomadura] parvosata subsp. kistnae]|uniref:Ribbon-helix-helix protein CopG domain-containing protein n=1 Tax=[Actinomadura] parvosata subsp. kistnae TaxID=1909395 RepID=A0A1V0AJT3_9ACTN|nr:hypothetical protein BKM31_16140 [Nonomuraea sp. ATCC 55076]
MTVTLIPQAHDQLQEIADRTRLSKTDIVNRAIALYGFIEGETAEGAEIVIRRASGESYVVKFF